jgi:hypothetical protein
MRSMPALGVPRNCGDPAFSELPLFNAAPLDYMRGIVNQQKGGDPVSHCHSPRSAASVTWIVASGGVRLG